MAYMIQVRCNVCEDTFEFSKDTYEALGLRSLPKSCPKCKDADGFTSVLDRKQMDLFPRVRMEIPRTWFFSYRKKTISSCKAVISGCPEQTRGKPRGRLPIFALFKDSTLIPEFVQVRVMESLSRHKTGAKPFKSTYLVLEPSKTKDSSPPILRYKPGDGATEDDEVFWSFEVSNYLKDTREIISTGFIEIV